MFSSLYYAVIISTRTRVSYGITAAVSFVFEVIFIHPVRYYDTNCKMNKKKKKEKGRKGCGLFCVPDVSSHHPNTA